MLDTYIWEAVQSTGKRQGTVFVTVPMAERMLGDQGAQRPLSKTRVASYAEQMSVRGKWQDDAGGALLFDREGRLRGGQHRLNAQVLAGVEISYNLRWDQTEAEIAADNEGGKPWIAADIAGRAGLPHAMLRQSIATALLILDHYDGEIGAQPTWHPGRLDVAKAVNDTRVVRAAEIAQSMRGVLNTINPTAIGVMYAVTANALPDVAPYFFESVKKGIGLNEGDPALTLRNLLTGPSLRHLAQKKWQTMYVTARAWNYHVQGEKTERIQRFVPTSNKPIRPMGWKPFFAK